MIALGIVFFVALSIGIVVSDGYVNRGDEKSVMKKLGKLSNEYSKSKQNEADIYASGKTVLVYKKSMDEATAFYVLAGQNKTEAKRTAENHIFEREVLYAEAVRKGYTATEAELRSYVENMKQGFKEAANREELQLMIDQFESEDAYWEYQYEVGEKNLLIQKYVAELEAEYRKSEQGKTGEGTWTEYFQQFKKELVTKQKFEVL